MFLKSEGVLDLLHPPFKSIYSCSHNTFPCGATTRWKKTALLAKVSVICWSQRNGKAQTHEQLICSYTLFFSGHRPYLSVLVLLLSFFFLWLVFLHMNEYSVQFNLCYWVLGNCHDLHYTLKEFSLGVQGGLNFIQIHRDISPPPHFKIDDPGQSHS